MSYEIIQGDCLEVLAGLEAESVQCVVTSPPYWGLRDYGVDGQLGLEATPEEYVEKMVDVFREVRRVLREDGVVWLNLGDTYNSNSSNQQYGANGYHGGEAGMARYNKQVKSLKPKDLCGVPWRVAFALQADGWWLRQDIIWAKPNPMPESVTDRCTKAHEYIFVLTKSARYYWDAEAIKEQAVTMPHAPGCKPRDLDNFQKRTKADGSSCSQWAADSQERIWGNGKCNKRSVWTIPTQPFPDAHFATYPEKLVEPCIAAGSKHDDIVLDPFAGSGTTGVVAQKMGRKFIGIELSGDYCAMAKKRIGNAMPLFERTEP